MTTHLNPAIVLVDDEPDVLTILHRLVRDFATGFDLVPVADGAAALAEIARRPVALLITDHRMPGMDGITLTAALKRVAPHCPVMLMSGYPSAELKQRGRAAGADFFLPKPFQCEQFEAMVQRALTR